LIASDDRGATWTQVADVKDGRYGPVFGADAKAHVRPHRGGRRRESRRRRHVVAALAAPKDLKGIGGLTWLAFDPKNDVLYLMTMGSDLFKLARGKAK